MTSWAGYLFALFFLPMAIGGCSKTMRLDAYEQLAQRTDTKNAQSRAAAFQRLYAAQQLTPIDEQPLRSTVSTTSQGYRRCALESSDGATMRLQPGEVLPSYTESMTIEIFDGTAKNKIAGTAALHEACAFFAKEASQLKIKTASGETVLTPWPEGTTLARNAAGQLARIYASPHVASTKTVKVDMECGGNRMPQTIPDRFQFPYGEATHGRIVFVGLDPIVAEFKITYDVQQLDHTCTRENWVD